MDAKVIADKKGKTLMDIMQEQIDPGSIIYTDTYHSFNALYVSEFRHHWINHSELFAKEYNNINGIKNFWDQTK